MPPSQHIKTGTSMPTAQKQLQAQLEKHRRKVDVEPFDVPLREIVRMASTGELRTSPAYQRKFRWTQYDESRLIESFFLGLPVPSIFVAANKDGTWELVDGLQRVSTLIHYMSDDAASLGAIDRNSNLVLKNLEKLTKFNNTSFRDLPRPLQLQFEKRSLRVTSLSDKSVYAVRFDMFERLNRGGIALSPQEVRNCIYRGEFADFLGSLAQQGTYKSLLKLQAKRERDGTAEELVLKFFAYLYDRASFKGNVKEFLNKYMEKARRSFEYETNRQLFEQVSGELSKVLGGRQFVRPSNGKVTPLTQLEACLVAIGEILREGQQPGVPEGNWIEDEELVRHSSKGTNARSSLLQRIARAKTLFQAHQPQVDQPPAEQKQ